MTQKIARIIGIDPGLGCCGWGVIDTQGNRLIHVADGFIKTSPKLAFADRLLALYEGLSKVIELYQPHSAVVEEVFVNKNPNSTLKLGMARGIALLVPAKAGLLVSEYAANLIKKSVVGSGHAEKHQVMMMVKMLLPGAQLEKPDAADALAAAICHAHHHATSLAQIVST